MLSCKESVNFPPFRLNRALSYPINTVHNVGVLLHKAMPVNAGSIFFVSYRLEQCGYGVDSMYPFSTILFMTVISSSSPQSVIFSHDHLRKF